MSSSARMGKVAESFDDGRIAHLVQKGLLTHRIDAFLPEEMQNRQKSEATILSSLDGRQADELAMRLAFVEVLLEVEVAGKVTRTDASMQVAMPRLQRRAMEILFEKPVKRGQAGRRGETVQPPSPGTLRKWHPCLHSAPQEAQETGSIQQAPLPKALPHREAFGRRKDCAASPSATNAASFCG
ncbi:MAG: hypothetical protein FJX25_08070 [Alphaproteobacteria bacterium]|nr:hypothetical protein [Alphaproteobacteria bacterium]